MEEAGQKLKRARERLGLRYRDVEDFSQQIADRHKNSEYIIAISRLSDIENRGVVPSLYKLYSLCAIYRLDMAEALRWYGVDLGELPADSVLQSVEKTHTVGFPAGRLGRSEVGEVQVPLTLDPGIDLKKTTFLSVMIQNWGVLPLMLISQLDPKNHRYGFVGFDDWFMHPLIQPGSLVMIDESRRKIAASGWTNEYDRPIYLVEHRDGWSLGWASQQDGALVMLPHPASGCAPKVFPNAAEVDIVGQVIGVASRQDVSRRRGARS